MKIDWKKVHEVLPGARFVAWDASGMAFSYTDRPMRSQYRADQWAAQSGIWVKVDSLFCQCPGEWNKVLLEFPGNYGEAEADIGALEAKLQALTKKVEEGKAASKDLRALSRAMGHIDAFLADTAAMKALDAAGIEVVFKERQQ